MILQIKYATTPEDFLQCWNAISALRPMLTQEKYLVLIESMKMQVNAHRLYLSKKFNITSHHFALTLQ